MEPPLTEQSTVMSPQLDVDSSRNEVDTDRVRSNRRKAMISSFLGATVEYYDFLLYGAAAGLVFPVIFFDDSMDQTIGVLISYTILFSGYLARPIGGILFGHLGDKFGRKNMLLVTMLLMGVVSIGIGLLPTYAQIGVAAPIILVLLRIVQGVAMGGEWAGAMLLSTEHAAKKDKGFAASIAVSGGPAGAVLSTLVLGLFAGLPEEQFMTWGWRIPFLLSALVVIYAIYLRLTVDESPEFEQAKREGAVHTGVPIKRIFTKYPKDTIQGIFAAGAPLFMQALGVVFAVPYIVSTGAIDRQTGLMMVTLTSALHVFAIPAFALLSDKIGRRKVMMGGGVVGIALIFPIFWMWSSGDYTWILVGFLLSQLAVQAFMYGPIGAFLAEKYSTEDRYTGVSVTYQTGAVIGSGLAPLMATWLLDLNDGKPTYVAIYFIVFVILFLIAVGTSEDKRPWVVEEKERALADSK